jgi:hypothetical protein
MLVSILVVSFVSNASDATLLFPVVPFSSTVFAKSSSSNILSGTVKKEKEKTYYLHYFKEKTKKKITHIKERSLGRFAR